MERECIMIVIQTGLLHAWWFEDGAVHQVKHASLTHILMSEVEADRTCHYNSHFQNSLSCLQGSLNCNAAK